MHYRGQNLRREEWWMELKISQKDFIKLINVQKRDRWNVITEEKSLSMLLELVWNYFEVNLNPIIISLDESKWR